MHSPQNHTLRCQLDPILPEDIDRILLATGLPEDQHASIRALLEDENERFQLLDQELFREIILGTAAELSESLVCFVRVRTQLLRVGIRNLKTAVYLTHVWLNYRAKGILPEQGQCQGPVIETVDILRELNLVKGYEKFELLTMSGNYYLFLMAFFEDYFHELEAQNEKLTTAYYEAFARISYRAARDHGLSEEFDLSGVCDDLSENFSAIRTAISGLQQATSLEPSH